jgi:thiol-disulfide isomerase/thioredoxin
MRTANVRNGVEAVCFLGAILLIIGMVRCASGAEMKAPPLGSVLPDFALKDFNGQERSLASCKGKVVVLDFCSQECPYSRGVDEALIELANTYADQGVVFLGVDSHKSTTPEQIKQYATEKKVPFPILKDGNNTYADAVGATRTPEFYILDKDLKLVYHGAFDDRKVPEKRGETNYVRNALDDVLGGKPVRTPQVDAWGCTIKRAK